MKYQLHSTLDTSKISYEEAVVKYPDLKILEHYNITRSGKKIYELLTSINSYNIQKSIVDPSDSVRTKVETLTKPDFTSVLYTETHYKIKDKPKNFKNLLQLLNENVLLAKVIKPTTHKYILTLRYQNEKERMDLFHTVKSYLEYCNGRTEEYCILDTNENMDYIHN